MVIETREEAERYGRREVADRPAGNPLQIGDRVVVEPCVAIPWPDVRRTDERPCPRVVLLPENLMPASLVLMSLRKRTVHLFQPMFESAYEEASADERERVLARVCRAVTCEAAQDMLGREDGGVSPDVAQGLAALVHLGRRR